MQDLYDHQYIEIMKDIMENGTLTEDRTSVGSSIQSFFKHIRFKSVPTLDGFNSVPAMQCRTFSPRISFLEWKWMMNGNTDAKWLSDRGVHIWDGNTTREFLDSRGLTDLPEGSIGKSYSYQFRNFGGVDQVKQLFESLRDNPTSRRHVVSIWNVGELKEAPLPPCAHLYEFMVVDGTLNLYQHLRSNDWLLGQPYNMMFGTFWLHSFAKALGFKVGEHALTSTNAHLYTNHIDSANETMTFWRNWGDVTTTPYMRINKELNTLEDILELHYEEVELLDWSRGPRHGNPEMAV